MLVKLGIKENIKENVLLEIPKDEIDDEGFDFENEDILVCTSRLNRNKNCRFYETVLGCFICLKNFADKNTYDDHLKTHRITEIKEISNYLLEMSYNLLPDSNKIKFKITSFENKISIEKIILFLEKFHYIHLDKLPYNLEGKNIKYIVI